MLMPIFVLLVLLLFSNSLYAGSLTPFISLGVYHRDCSISDRILCDNPNIGSDTPGTIDLGVRIRECGWWCLKSTQVDIGLFHQSYVDRGQDHVIFGNPGPESYMNMYGARFHWEIESWTIRW